MRPVLKLGFYPFGDSPEETQKTGVAALLFDSGGTPLEAGFDPLGEDGGLQPVRLFETHLARVDRPHPELGGAFVQLEGGEEGFLALGQARAKSAPPARWEKTAPKKGDLIGVSITREADSIKGMRLRPLKKPHPLAELSTAQTRNAEPARISKAPLQLEVIGLLAADARIEAPAEIAALLPATLKGRITLNENAFDAEARELYAALLEKTIRLDDDRQGIHTGITASLTETPALWVADFDAPAGSGFEENKKALKLLLRQLRLRGIGGLILVDPAGLAPAKRRALGKFLPDLIREEGDRAKTEYLGTTPSGLLEIRRARTPRLDAGLPKRDKRK